MCWRWIVKNFLLYAKRLECETPVSLLRRKKAKQALRTPNTLRLFHFCPEQILSCFMMAQQYNKDEDKEIDPKIWYILLDGRQLGPFNLRELKRNRRFTLDTLVWKEGFSEWIPARFVPEIIDLFKEEITPQTIHEKFKGKGVELGKENQATLTLQQDPYQLLLWILLLLLAIFYTYYQFYHS